jgi:hypothetical protein
MDGRCRHEIVWQAKEAAARMVALGARGDNGELRVPTIPEDLAAALSK